MYAEAATAIGADLPFQLFGGFWMGAVVDHDLGPQFCQIFDNGLADATIAAGDDGDFALEQVG